MSTKLVNILAVGVMAALVLGFEFGARAPSNAFFGVLAVLILFTAYQFLGHDGAPLGQAVRMVFIRPTRAKGEAGRMLSYFAYVGVGAVGLLVAVQAISTV